MIKKEGLDALKMDFMKKENKNIKPFDQHLDEEYDKKGTAKRNEFEAGYEAFKLGVLIQN